jgi:predicted nuclease of predicted toxin-antitoxin system
MKFLADENFPLQALDVLRSEGFDVSSIREIQPGASDERVLALCAAERRALITLDKDFGEMAFQQRLPAASGILLFRIAPQDADEIARLALGALRSRADWSGCFAVITRKSIRTRSLKP